MLTSSVNVVQSNFPEADKSEISGLSRSVSNLGSSLGTALVSSILVAVKLPEGKPFAVAGARAPVGLRCPSVFAHPSRVIRQLERGDEL